MRQSLVEMLFLLKTKYLTQFELKIAIVGASFLSIQYLLFNDECKKQSVMYLQ